MCLVRVTRCPHLCGVDKFQLPLAPLSTSECFPASGGKMRRFNSFYAGLPNYIARKKVCLILRCGRIRLILTCWRFMRLGFSQCQPWSPCWRTKWFTHAANRSNKHRMNTLKNPMVPPISQGALPVPDANWNSNLGGLRGFAVSFLDLRPRDHAKWRLSSRAYIYICVCVCVCVCVFLYIYNYMNIFQNSHSVPCCNHSMLHSQILLQLAP